MEPVCVKGVFTLHSSNIKGFASEFACSRPVWIGPQTALLMPHCQDHFNLASYSLCELDTTVFKNNFSFLKTQVLNIADPFCLSALRNPGFLVIKCWYRRPDAQNRSRNCAFRVGSCPTRLARGKPVDFRFTLGNVSVDLCTGKITVKKVCALTRDST